MNKNGTSLSVIEHFIGTGTANTLSKLGIDPVDPSIATVILSNIEIVEDPSLLPLAREKLFSSLIRIEQRISGDDKLSIYHNDEGLKYNSELLLSKTASENKRTFSLTEKAATELLTTVPPVNLYLLLNAQDTSEALSKMSARGLLALTRHTEDSEWQENYYRELSSLSASDFSEKQILVNPVPETLFQKSLSRPIYEKPWGLSHSKEVGVISMFPKDYGSYITPNLLLTAVYHHYIEELKFASHYFVHNVKENRPLGPAIVKLIQNERKPLEALRDKNVYDETLYWDRGLAEFHKSWLKPEDVWATEQDKAVAIPNAFVSHNIVDSLWSLNLESSCTYHFRQALWCKIVKEYSNLEQERYEQILIENLAENDRELSRKILE